MITFRATKDSSATLAYGVEWWQWLAGDTIVASVWAVPAGLTAGAETFTAQSTQIVLAGGTPAVSYQVVNTITTAGGLIQQATLEITCGQVTTVGDVISDALRLAGLTSAPGRTKGGSAMTEGLYVANQMLDDWNADRLSLFSIRIDQYPTVPNQQIYTLGPGGDWDAPRPEQITAANVIYQAGGSLPLRIPLYPMTDEEWAGVKLTGVTSTFPTRFYNDGNYPQSSIYLWPIPTANYSIELFTWQMLGSYAALTDSVILPPSYRSAIAYSLAVELAARDPQRAKISPLTVQKATEKLAKLQAKNAPSPLMTCDSGVTSIGSRGKSSLWNWRTGEYGR